MCAKLPISMIWDMNRTRFQVGFVAEVDGVLQDWVVSRIESFAEETNFAYYRVWDHDDCIRADVPLFKMVTLYKPIEEKF